MTGYSQIFGNIGPTVSTTSKPNIPNSFLANIEQATQQAASASQTQFPSTNYLQDWARNTALGDQGNWAPELGIADQLAGSAASASGYQAAAPYIGQATGLSALGTASPYMSGARSQNGAGAASPYLTTGTQTFPSAVGQYMSPYTSYVTDRIAQLGQRNLTQNLLPAVNDTFTGAGQFGGTRNADFTQRAIQNTNESILGEQAKALEAGYNEAGTLFGQDANRQLQAGQTLGGLTNAYGQNLTSLANVAGTQAGTDQRNLLSAGQLAGNLTTTDAQRQLAAATLYGQLGAQRSNLAWKDITGMEGLGNDLFNQQVQGAQWPMMQAGNYANVLRNLMPAYGTTSQGINNNATPLTQTFGALTSLAGLIGKQNLGDAAGAVGNYFGLTGTVDPSGNTNDPALTDMQFKDLIHQYLPQATSVDGSYDDTSEIAIAARGGRIQALSRGGLAYLASGGEADDDEEDDTPTGPQPDGSDVVRTISRGLPRHPSRVFTRPGGSRIPTGVPMTPGMTLDQAQVLQDSQPAPSFDDVLSGALSLKGQPDPAPSSSKVVPPRTISPLVQALLMSSPQGSGPVQATAPPEPAGDTILDRFKSPLTQFGLNLMSSKRNGLLPAIGEAGVETTKSMQEQARLDQAAESSKTQQQYMQSLIGTNSAKAQSDVKKQQIVRQMVAKQLADGSITEDEAQAALVDPDKFLDNFYNDSSGDDSEKLPTGMRKKDDGSWEYDPAYLEGQLALFQAKKGQGSGEKLPTGMFRNPSTGKLEYDPAYIEGQGKIAEAKRPQINVNMPSKEYQKDSDKAASKQFDNILATAEGAEDEEGWLNRMESAVKTFHPDPNFGGLKLSYYHIASALGVPGITDKMSEGDLLQSIGQQFAWHLKPKGQGHMTEREVAAFQQSLPNLLSTEAGALKVIDFYRRIRQRQSDLADIAQQVATDNPRGMFDPVEYRKRAKALGPVFSQDDVKVMQGPGQKPEDTDPSYKSPVALPAGPNGEVRKRFQGKNYIKRPPKSGGALDWFEDPT